MKLFETNFTGVTNPALTPSPFDVVVESAQTDLAYGAAVGIGSTPGMRVIMNGTGAGQAAFPCYGEADIAAVAPNGVPLVLAGRHLRCTFSFKTAGVTGFANGDEITLLRLTNCDASGAEVEMLSVAIQKVSATTWKFRLTQTIGGSTSVLGGSIIATTNASYETYCLDVIGVGDAPFAQVARCNFLTPVGGLAANGAVQIALGGPPPPLSKIRVGGVASTIAAPTAASELNFDHLLYEDDRFDAAHFRRDSGDVIPLLGSRLHETGMVQLADGAYAVFGGMAATDENAVQTGLVPGPNIAIQPGGLYEVSCQQASSPAGAPGYTELQFHRHNVNQVTRPVAQLIDMARASVWQQRALEDQTALTIYNKQTVTCNYVVRRLR